MAHPFFVNIRSYEWMVFLIVYFELEINAGNAWPSGRVLGRISLYGFSSGQIYLSKWEVYGGSENLSMWKVIRMSYVEDNKIEVCGG